MLQTQGFSRIRATDRRSLGTPSAVRPGLLSGLLGAERGRRTPRAGGGRGDGEDDLGRIGGFVDQVDPDPT